MDVLRNQLNRITTKVVHPEVICTKIPSRRSFGSISLVWWLTALARAGVSPNRLAEFYQDVR
jgi:hypothetical protein